MKHILSCLSRLTREIDELKDYVSNMQTSAQVQIPDVRASPAEDGEAYLTARQVQDMLHISESTFYAWLSSGQLAPGRRFGARSRRWTRSDIETASTLPMFEEVRVCN